MTMRMHDLRSLFEHGVMEAYDAETRLLDNMEQMSRDATDLRVRALLDEHKEQTRNQAQRLRKVFDALHREASGGEGCRGILGIVQEREAFKAMQPSPQVLQTFDVAASTKIEHYEIAMYQSLVALAQKLGLEDVKTLLGESLAEEREMLRRLDAMAYEDFTPPRGQAAQEQGTRAPGRR